MAEAVIDQLYLEIEKLEKQRKLEFFIFVILILPAFILTFLALTVFAGAYYLADLFGFLLTPAWYSAFIGFFLAGWRFSFYRNAINNRKMRIELAHNK